MIGVSESTLRGLENGEWVSPKALLKIRTFLLQSPEARRTCATNSKPDSPFGEKEATFLQLDRFIKYVEGETAEPPISQIAKPIGQTQTGAISPNQPVLNAVIDRSEELIINSDTALPQKWVHMEKDAMSLAAILKESDSNASRVIEVFGMGGSGKSCFTRHFLENITSHELRFERKIWFSFYKLRGQIDPFDQFLNFTLKRVAPESFGDGREAQSDKRVRLEEIFRKGNHFLVLDGLEIAQDKFGALLNPEFTKFLRSFLNFRASRLIVTTRVQLQDLENQRGYRQVSLSEWTPAEFCNYLRSYEIDAAEDHASGVIRKLGSHALTLTAFGYLLKTYYKAEIANAPRVIQSILRSIGSSKSKSPIEQQVRRLRAVLTDIWSRLGKHERVLMTRLSALYGEADEYALPALTDLNPSGDEFLEMRTRLVDSRLLISDDREDQPTLNAHPLVKQFCYDKMPQSERLRIHKSLGKFFSEHRQPDLIQNSSDLDNVVEWFQQCLRGGMFKEAYQIIQERKLYYIGWYQGQLELIQSLTAKVLESKGPTRIGPNERIVLSMTQGHIARKLGHPNKALAHFEDAEQIAVKSRLEVHEYAARIEKGITHGFLGNFREAFQLLPTAPLDIDTIYDAARLEWLGLVIALQGQIDQGIKHLNDAVSLARLRKNERHLPAILTHYGDILLCSNRIQEAERCFSEAAKWSRDKNYRDYEGDATRGLGDVARRTGRTTDAREYYRQALAIGQKLGYQFLKVQTHIGLARLAALDNPEALLIARSALQISSEAGYKYLQAEAHLILAEREILEDRQQHFIAAENLIHSMRFQVLSQDLERLRSQSVRLRKTPSSILQQPRT